MEFFLQMMPGGLSGVIVAFLVKKWVTARIENSIKHEYDKNLEDLKGIIQTQVSQNHERWLIKRKACLKALTVANATLSNYEYPNAKSKDILKQYITIEEARMCVDEIACSCDSSEVLDVLKEILFGSVTPDKIVDLRNAIRRELNFSSQEIDSDRDKAFIGKLNCIKANNNEETQ